MTRRMIFPDRVLGMSATIHTLAGRAIFPISRSIASTTRFLVIVAGGVAGFQRDVHLDCPTAQLVHDGHRRGFRDLIDGQAGRLELFGAQTVSGDVDDVVDTAEDAEVAVRACMAPSPAK